MPDTDSMPDDSIQAIKAHLKLEFGLEGASAEQMLTEYLENLEELIAEADSSLMKRDARRLGNAGHTLMGLAGSLGSNSISRCGGLIEKEASPDFNPGLLRSTLESIRRQYGKLKEERKS